MLDAPGSLKSLLKKARLKHFPKAQIILYKGDLPSEVYIVKNGTIKLYDIDEQGNEKILHIVGPGALVPLAFFSGDNTPVHWFYVALTDCELHVLPKATLESAMQNDSALTIYLMNSFSDEVHELLVRLSSLEKTTVHAKMCAALKFLVIRHAKPHANGWWRVTFGVNHQLLADLSGITRESATMTMKQLQSEKLVRSPRLGVLDIKRDKLLELDQ